MSFIRQGQEGTYVEIPGGSNYYIYGQDDINGWSRAEFAALIGGVIDELPDDAFNGQPRGRVRDAFTEQFGGWDDDYDGGITPPERAEIFCQCVDRRIPDVELTDTLQTHVTEWADEFDAFRECDYCGTEFRPYIYHAETGYVCNSDECELKSDADQYELSLEEMRRANVIDAEVGFDAGWDYLTEHSPLEIFSEDTTSES